jgi:hypothetical protein
MLYRYARSRKRDGTGQPTLPIGQANEPIPAASGAEGCPSLHDPNSVGKLGGCRSRRFQSPHRKDTWK